jgi:hypothetical protein
MRGHTGRFLAFAAKMVAKFHEIGNVPSVPGFLPCIYFPLGLVLQ